MKYLSIISFIFLIILNGCYTGDIPVDPNIHCHMFEAYIVYVEIDTSTCMDGYITVTLNAASPYCDSVEWWDHYIEVTGTEITIELLATVCSETWETCDPGLGDTTTEELIIEIDPSITYTLRIPYYLDTYHYRVYEYETVISCPGN